MHASRLADVSIDVTPRLVWLMAALLPFCAAGADAPRTADVSKALKGIEKRYNGAKTLQVSFNETYKVQGRTRTESGDLSLRKPGRMRWQYSNPAGKLFVSDGKTVYFYSPETNRAEKMKMKETEDMRAPMAFLLGRLDFDKDFGQYRSQAQANGLLITAIPKSDKMPYRDVTFLVGPGDRIDRLIVTGQDSSILEFSFSGEKLNPPVDEGLFRFQLPKGAEFVDSSESGVQ